MQAKLKLCRSGALLLLPLILLLAPTPALATGILDTIISQMDAMTGEWMTRAIQIALMIFVALAVIEIAWHGIQLVLKQGELSELIAGVMLKVVALGFFYTLIVFSGEWIPLISDSFGVAGERISGLAPGQLTPSGVISTGIDVANRVFEAPLEEFSLMEIGRGLLTSIIAAVAALTILAAFVIIGLQLFIVKVEMFLVLSGGVVMMGMSGSRWTMNFSEKYIGYAISVGAKMIVIALLAGFGVTFGNEIVAQLTADNDVMRMPQLFSLIGTGGIFAIASFMIPSLAGSFLSGAASMSLTNAAAAGGSMASMAGSGIGRTVGVAAGMAGGALGMIAKIAAPVSPVGAIAGMAASAAGGAGSAGGIGGSAFGAAAGKAGGSAAGGASSAGGIGGSASGAAAGKAGGIGGSGGGGAGGQGAGGQGQGAGGQGAGGQGAGGPVAGGQGAGGQGAGGQGAGGQGAGGQGAGGQGAGGAGFANPNPGSAGQGQDGLGSSPFDSGRGGSGGGNRGPMDYRDEEQAAEKDFRARASSSSFSRAMLKASDRFNDVGDKSSAFARRQRRPLASDGHTGGAPSIRLDLGRD